MMRRQACVLVTLSLALAVQAAFLEVRNPAGGAAMGATEPARPPNYRNAWDDCGGAGASSTERMRAIAASIKGFAKEQPFVRNAAQDCGHVQSDGQKPGPGTTIVYPGAAIWQSATDGLMTADTALEKYGVKTDATKDRLAFLQTSNPAGGAAMGATEPARPPNYRNAWDDCGGAGASSTERMRAIAASIKGFAKEQPFVRNAAQDCGHVQSDGQKPGPGTTIVYPGAAIWQSATDGLMTADTALEKYGVKTDATKGRVAFLQAGNPAGGAAMGATEPARPPNYRNAWDDCGGAGASSTERMRAIAASIKGFAKEQPFVRNAAQDCGHVQSDGQKPGPGTTVVYPGAAIWQSATDGLMTADTALEKYGVKTDATKDRLR